MIQAKVIADSKNEFGNRITTMIVTFPRFILAELNTHRMFSRNSASSRAIPFHKMVESVRTNPFIPIAWQRDHKGMQGTEYLHERDSEVCKSAWLVARNKAIEQAIYLSERGATKQLCNRLLEPFMWHTVIITATEWENFFALRCPKYEVPYTWDTETKTFRSKKDATKYWQDKADLDSSIGQPIERSEMDWLKLNKGQAEIHMMALAEAIWDAYNESTPKELKAGEWHIPFSDDIDTYTGKVIYEPLARVKIATAMCARVSYTVVGEEGKEPNLENDLKLHDKLAESGHWSPFEHCAKAMDQYSAGFAYGQEQLHTAWSGNFRGFIQYRKTFQNENITKTT